MVLLREFDDEFERIYGERLRNKIDSLLKSGEKYSHLIFPGLQIEFRENAVVFEREHDFKIETNSVQEAYEIIKRHMGRWLGYCLWDEEQSAKTIQGLESFLAQP